MRRIRKFILTNDDEGKGSGPVMVGTVLGGSNSAVLAFEKICRDQPPLRAAAAKITTIVLEPITDMKYLADHDKIAFARRTNDWTAVHDAAYEANRGTDEHRPRFAVSGATLTVSQNIMGYAGGHDELSTALADALGKSDGSKKPDAPAERKPAGCLTRARRPAFGRSAGHVMRHTFASHLAMEGASMKVIEDILGHASIVMTMRYAHLARDAVRLLDSDRRGRAASKIE